MISRSSAWFVFELTQRERTPTSTKRPSTGFSIWSYLTSGSLSSATARLERHPMKGETTCVSCSE